MSLSHHPNIVRNGLVFYNDPANFKSYPAGKDSYVNNISLLLDFEGNFTDKSFNNRTVTANGSASISSSQYKYGFSSLYLDGSNSYLTVSGDFSQAGDFTVECWIYITNTTGVKNIFCIGNETTERAAVYLNGSSLGYDTYSTGTPDFTGGTVSTNVWNHIALVRSGTTLTLYLNGTSVGTGSKSGTLGNSGGFSIGSTNPSDPNDFSGYIDDFELIKYAKYTSNFTPPTAPLSLPNKSIDLTSTKSAISYSSGVTFSSSNVGSMALNGSAGSYGSGTNFLTVGPTSSFTACAWVKYNSTVTSGPARCSAIAKSANTNDFEAVLGFPYTYSSSKLGLEVGKAGVQSQTAYALNSNPTGVWYHLAGVFMNGSGNFYINGIYQSSVTYNATVNSANSNSNAWIIGTEPFNGSASGPFVNGNVGPTMVYNRILSNNEILQNYNAQKARYGL